MTSAINELKFSQNQHFIHVAKQLRPNVETYRYVLYDSSDSKIGNNASIVIDYLPIKILVFGGIL